MSTAPASGVVSRLAAYRAVRRVHRDGSWSAPAVDAALRASDLDARDRAFAANLAYETLRWEGSLDWALARVSTRPLARLDPEVLDVLRLGAWQLLHGRQPDRAAVGTAVDVARAEIGPHVTGFVNGALRALARQRDDGLPWPAGDQPGAVGLRLGYPGWVVAEAQARFGTRADAVLEAGNAAPGVTLRATGDREALLAELAAAGLAVEPGAYAPEAVRAPGADPGRLAAVREGRAVVQDEASMLVARAVLPPGTPPGAVVLDACAGPGGKTTHLAQLGAHVVATELQPVRARLVAEAAARLPADRGADRVAVAVADAVAPPLPPASVDAALVDAPCTGFGVVRRRPEIRWARDPADPERLAALQLAILDRVATLVRPGGRLVYSACTWTVAETQQVAARLLAVAGDLVELDDTAAALGGAGTRLDGDPGVQLAPDLDGVDGMYVLVLRRR